MEKKSWETEIIERLTRIETILSVQCGLRAVQHKSDIELLTEGLRQQGKEVNALKTWKIKSMGVIVGISAIIQLGILFLK